MHVAHGPLRPAQHLIQHDIYCGYEAAACGTHVDLNEAAKALIESKAERLFRHEPRILRPRLCLGSDNFRPSRPRHLATDDIRAHVALAQSD